MEIKFERPKTEEKLLTSTQLKLGEIYVCVDPDNYWTGTLVVGGKTQHTFLGNRQSPAFHPMSGWTSSLFEFRKLEKGEQVIITGE